MKPEQAEKIINQNKEIYNQIAKDFSGTRKKSWQGFENFSQYVKAGDRVLDLGCGNGRMADIFQNKKVEYLGIDNSEELIKIARERFRDKSWIRFEVGDVIKLSSRGAEGDVGIPSDIEGDGIATVTSFPRNDNFNLVLMIAVLHHIPTKELRLKILQDAFTLLKPGGRLVISNWNLWQIFSCHCERSPKGEARQSRFFNSRSSRSLRSLRMTKRFRYYKYLFNYVEKFRQGDWNMSDAFVPWKPLGGNNLRYIHSFGKSELKRLLKRAGFKIEKIGFESKNGRPAMILTGDNLLAVAVKK